MTVIDRNGAPAGEKHVVILNPPVDRRAPGHPARPARPVASDARWPSCGPAARRSCSPRSRVARGAAADRPARGVPRGPRAARADPRLSQRLPAHRSGAHRSRPAQRRGARRGQHQRARAGHRHRPAGRGDPGRLSRARSPRRGSRWAAPAGARTSSVAILVAGASARRPVRRRRTRTTSSTRRPRRRGWIPTNLHVLLAHVRAATFEMPFDPGDSLRRRAHGRPAGVPRRGGPRPPGGRRALVLGERELPGVGDHPPRRRARRTS